MCNQRQIPRLVIKLNGKKSVRSVAMTAWSENNQSLSRMGKALTCTSAFCFTVRLSLFAGRTWYMSWHGSDKDGCGAEKTSACQSLDWLLSQSTQDQSHNTSMKTLKISTDRSFVIDGVLMVGCFAFFGKLAKKISKSFWQH